MKRMMIVSLLGLLLLTPATRAFAYPPDNAAVLYYWALSLIPNEQELCDRVTEYAKGKISLDEEIDRFIRRQKWLIRLLSEGSRVAHCDWGIDYSRGIGTRLPELHRLNFVTRLMVADARRLKQSGDIQQALERLLCVQRMATHVSEGVTICHLVGLSMRKVSYPVLAEILSADSLSEEMLVWLKSELGQAGPSRQGLHKALTVETKSILCSFTLEKLPLFFEEAEAVPEHTESVKRMLDNLPPVNAAYLQKTRQYYVEFKTQLQVNLEKPFDQAYGSIQALEKTAQQDLIQNSGALATVLFMADYGKCLCADTRARTRFNAMRAAIELYLIKQRSGQLPNTLPPGLPQDCFGGRDFAYNKNEEGFTLRWQDPDPKPGVRGDCHFKVN